MATVNFPKDAFRQAALDYTRENYNSGVDACLWRELIQNARDAGATRVDATVRIDNSVTVLTFADNGKGMTKDVLVNGMLTYAGSIKSNGAAGGFGMAKCLLVFAPSSCRIETNDLAVHVEGINYEWEEVKTPIRGTRLTLTINNEGFEKGKQLTPTEEGLRFLLARCDLKGMAVYCNGKLVRDTHLRADDEPVRDWKESKTKAYHLKKADPVKNLAGAPVMVVQHRGIWVMDIQISEEVKGAVWANIEEEPRRVLNAARVSLGDYNLRHELDKFATEMARSPKMSLKTKKFAKRWDGNGLTTVRDATEAARMMLRNSKSVGIPVHVVTDNQKEFIRQLADALAKKTGTDNRVPAELLEPSRINMDADDSELSKQLACLAWSPAMMVVNERETEVNPQWLPETMGKKAKRLLTVWSEMVKQFLILSKAYGCTFGVGFVFSDECLALWRREEDGTVWFLLNPLATDGRMRFNLSDTHDKNVMISEAAHEVCHQIVRDSWHGDEFANRLTDLFTLSHDHSSTFNAIWKIRPND